MATRYCSVHNCTENNLSPGVSFYKIRPEWLHFINQQRKDVWEPKPNSKICSVHFTRQQINNRNNVRAGEMPSLIRPANSSSSYRRKQQGNISSGIVLIGISQKPRGFFCGKWNYAKFREQRTKTTYETFQKTNIFINLQDFIFKCMGKNFI